jgi:hypothetical protein
MTQIMKKRAEEELAASYTRNNAARTRITDPILD